MRRMLGISLVSLVAVAAPAIAQTGGQVGLYTDSDQYADCLLSTPLFTPLEVYIVHQLTDALGSHFQVLDYGTGLVHTGFTPAHENVVGDDPFVELRVTYDALCPHMTPILIGTIALMNTGSADVCASFWVGGAPSTGQITALGCDGVERIATGGFVFTNPDEYCSCLHIDPPTPVRGSTWGAIKSQYR